MDQTQWIVKRIIWQSEDKAYTVASLEANDSDLKITAAGAFPPLHVGMPIRVDGIWKTHPKYGKQLEVKAVETELPVEQEGLESFLAAGAIKGIGPTLAAKIIQKFGAKTRHILDHEPNRLLEVKGIKKGNLPKIIASWQQINHERDVMIFLVRMGLTPRMAMKVFNELGSATVQVVKKNPYELIKHVRGFGFLRADAVAMQMGIAPNSPFRIEACVRHVLDMTINSGHTHLPEHDLIGGVVALLKTHESYITDAITRMIERAEIIRIPINNVPVVYLGWLYRSEYGIAEHLMRLTEEKNTYLTAKHLYEKDPTEMTSQAKMLTKTQRQAITNALKYPISILTGGPGTGKTTVLRALVEIVKKAGVSLAQAAPTGRASQRIMETTQYNASTIHRLLGYTPENGGTFKANEEAPLDHNFIIIDEMSMVDVYLLHSLLRAVKTGSHILFVGDADQLPSVGAGNVLNDLIKSGKLPVTTLTEVFRQDDKSFIVYNAHRINKGEMPIIINDTKKNNDFFFFLFDEPADIAKQVVELVTDRIPKTFGFKPKQEIQVLAPMHKGDVGVANFNSHLQAILNPPHPGKKERTYGKDLVFRVGDKVMQLKNDYTLEIFNGDVGYIRDITEDGPLIIEFTGKEVEYPADNLENLTLAYCATIHKSQGSEFPCVVIPVHMSQRIMLKRNLIYTAVTRAKQVVVLVGQKQAMGLAVSNDMVETRFTGLITFMNMLFA